MKAWRSLLLLSFLLLNGCLVTFREPIPANEAAPMPLLGTWSRTDEWGELRFLDVSRSGSNLYKADTYTDSPDNVASLTSYSFTVAHHGRRWYLSAGVPKRMGANFAIGGFELTQNNELVLFNLDVERVQQAIADGALQGQTVNMPQGDGVLVSSPLAHVLAYLNDPANSDLFVEVARYQKATP